MLLVTEVAQLQELGVSAADATGVIQSLTRTFGMNAHTKHCPNTRN